MADAIVRLKQAGAAHHVPLFRAAMSGLLRIAFVSAGHRVPIRFLDPAEDSRPLVVILADDAGAPTGPAGFPQSVRLMRWANRRMIHGAGGEAWHYSLAAQAALAAGRVLIVETDTAHEAEWFELAARVAPRTPTLRVLTRPGARPHPCVALPAGERLQ